MKKEENKKIVKDVVNSLDEHIVGKSNLQRYTNKLKTYFDEKLSKSYDITSVYGVNELGEQTNIRYDIENVADTLIYRGDNGSAKVAYPQEDDDIATKKYVDEQVIAPGFVTKTYVDEQDEKVLKDSKTYTDGKLNDYATKEYVAEREKYILNYAESKADQAEQNAKGYADNKFLEKKTEENTLYGIDENQQQKNLKFSEENLSDSIVKRKNDNTFECGTPVNDKDVINKKFFEDNLPIIPDLVEIANGGTGARTIDGALTNLGLKGVEKATILWVNARPQDSFPPQDIALDLSSYIGIIVYYETQYHYPGQYGVISRIEKNNFDVNAQFTAFQEDAGVVSTYSRICGCNNTTVKFHDGVEIYTPGTKYIQNLILVPQKIYGIREV